MRNVIQAVCACLLTFSIGSAQQRDVAAYRDFDLVKRLRVVCEHQHLGRVHDLVADVATGCRNAHTAGRGYVGASGCETIPHQIREGKKQDDQHGP